jgi:hypothetical protein
MIDRAPTWLPVAVALALTASGCSLVFVRGPTPATPAAEGSQSCTQSRAAPIVDVALGGLPASGGLILGLMCVSTEFCREENPEVLGGSLLALAVGVPLLISAMVGFDRVDRCEEAQTRP